jgi:threonine synthase
MFADLPFREEMRLSAVNSINWARIAAQVVYYFTSAVALGSPDIPVSFAVPTGNFGNVYAGHVARRMGLPIRDLIIGTNRNDILHRFIESGEMRIAAVEPSLSPSMDIQVSSNFERLYFDLVGRDGDALAAAMNGFRATGMLPANPGAWHAAREGFKSCRVDDALTRATIAAHYRATGALIDPHSAVAVAAMRARKGDPAIPHVALACAHAAKFPEIVAEVTGIHPPLPGPLADLMSRPERINPLPNDLGAVRAFVSARARRAV